MCVSVAQGSYGLFERLSRTLDGLLTGSYELMAGSSRALMDSYRLLTGYYGLVPRPGLELALP